MCRLFAYISTNEVGAEFRALMRTFQKQAIDNPDGWGFAWYQDGPKLLKKPESAYQNDEFLQTADRIRSRIVIAHIRNSSRGRDRWENTHPFQFGDWSFAHNGTLGDMGKMKDELEDEYQSRIAGQTDSEVLFQWLLHDIDREGVEDGVIEAIHHIEKKESWDSTAMNFLLTNGTQLFAYRRAFKKWSEYTLHYLRREEALIISSDPLTEEKWTSIPTGGLLFVNENLDVVVKST